MTAKIAYLQQPLFARSRLRDSLVKQTVGLVKIASQGGIDSQDKVISSASLWLKGAGIEHEIISSSRRQPRNAHMGIMASMRGSADGPKLALIACLDTAPFGEESDWTRRPTSGALIQNRIYGRGAADSKSAVSIFCHLMQAFNAHRSSLHGEITLLLDSDEHTGRFGAVRHLLSRHPDLSCAYIGYPDSSNIKIGARGFLRAQITFRGKAAHSGARKPGAENAISKAVHFLQKLSDTATTFTTDKDFGLPPKVTPTSVVGGRGYSIVPDRCKVRIDIRLTPMRDRRWAEQLIYGIISSIDGDGYGENRSTVRLEKSWPAYRVPEETPFVAALKKSAERSFERTVPVEVSGPSNVGNLLSSYDIPATCGFGVDCGGIHGYDEYAEIGSFLPVYNSYYGALSELLLRPA